MKAMRLPLMVTLMVASVVLLSSAIAIAQGDQPQELSSLQQWNGAYPVSLLNRLPEGQRTSRVGYLGDAAAFSAVWKSFK
jgi:hypothetical protein